MHMDQIIMERAHAAATTASSAPSDASSSSAQIMRFFGRTRADNGDSDQQRHHSLSSSSDDEDDDREEKMRMERVYREIAGQKRRKRYLPTDEAATHCEMESGSIAWVEANGQVLSHRMHGSGTRRHRRRKKKSELAAGYGHAKTIDDNDDDDHEITTEYLDAVLMKPDDQVLNKYTRFFLDKKLETLYQEYTAINWFVWARWHVLVWVGAHVFANLLFVILPYSGFIGMDMFVYSIDSVPLWFQYTYLPIAIPFAMLPNRVNPFQKRWRSWVCFIVIIFNFTFQLWMASANRLAVEYFESVVEPRFKCIPPDAKPFNSTAPPRSFPPTTRLPTTQELAETTVVQLATAFRVTEQYAGALIQVLIAFSSLFSFIFVVSVRLEWVQAMIVGLMAMLTYVIVVSIFELGLEWMTATCYLFAVVLLLILSHASDRNNRRSFLSQLRVDKENETMKSFLTKAEAVLLNDPAGEAEKKVVGSVLDIPEMEHLELVRIPFDDLKLLQAIGRGAMGDVIKAKYFGTIVVCKRLRREQITEAAILQFREEIQLMATLRHPNIVQFIGASWDNCSNVCIVMEFLENGDMHSVLHSTIGRGFTWADPLLKMAIDAAQGMLYLHSQETPIVHRDFKSVNIFCSATFGCKVGDFGLSRRFKKDIDALTTLVGTPFWLAPEIIRNERYGPPADVFSFGIVLTELETRRTPYHDLEETGLKVLMRIAQNKLRPSLPVTCLPHRRQLIMDCLHDDPSRRPTFAQVLARLQGPVQQEVEESMLRATTTLHDRSRLVMRGRGTTCGANGSSGVVDSSAGCGVGVGVGVGGGGGGMTSQHKTQNGPPRDYFFDILNNVQNPMM